MFALSNDDLGADPARFGAPFEQFLTPRRVYQHPQDVLTDGGLAAAEKRAVLSAWASDAHAVDSAPPLRRPPFAACAVSIDEVMAALRRLDELGSSQTARRARRAASEAIAA